MLAFPILATTENENVNAQLWSTRTVEPSFPPKGGSCFSARTFSAQGLAKFILHRSKPLELEMSK